MKLNYTIDTFKAFIFDRNWLEPPLFYNNNGKVLRFDLVSKPENESYRKICDVFDDLFAEGSYVYTVFFGTKGFGWKSAKCYFDLFSLRKIIKRQNYVSRDDDLSDENPYIVVCKTKKANFKQRKFFTEYLRGEHNACIVFFSLKKLSAINFYDNRGFDLFSEDAEFLNLMRERYKAYILNTEKS